MVLFEFVPKAGVGRTVFLGAAGLRTLEIQDNVAEVFRCSAGVQREGKHLGTGKTVENKRALGLEVEVFRCSAGLRPDKTTQENEVDEI